MPTFVLDCKLDHHQQRNIKKKKIGKVDRKRDSGKHQEEAMLESFASLQGQMMMSAHEVLENMSCAETGSAVPVGQKFQ